MAEFNEDLARWFEELQKVPAEHHLLCPKISTDDAEDYKSFDDIYSRITVEEKKKRIEDGDRRIEITYWNSLIFGFDKKDAGKWLNEFTTRLEDCLKSCPGCVLNWHMKRRANLQKFAERWNEEAMHHIEHLLERLDVARIDHNIDWAKKFIEKIEDSGATFKKAQFGQHLPEVLITVYEALCCVPYIGFPEKRSSFQYVFMRLQGKTYLKLGSTDPLPGMTYSLFDTRVEDRLKWAQENWKTIGSSSMTEEQFDWAVSGGLVKGIDDICQKDLSQPTSEDYLDIERFWQGFECVLRTLTDDLIVSRLRNLEVRPGNPHVYDLLFRHIQFCRSEGVLVATIKVLTELLRKSPKAFWNVVGDAKPNVIADLIFASPVYRILLRQSLEDCWSGVDSAVEDSVPFPISWITPWLQSLGRDRRYDACEVLTHTLFRNLAKDATLGEPGQAACIRAGFDAMTFTMKSFLDDKTEVIASGTTHLYASSAFNLVVENKDLLVWSLKPPGSSNDGWTTLKVASAAKSVLHTARKLDMKMLAEEYFAINDGKKPQVTVTRNSTAYWECLIEMFDMSSDQAEIAKDILTCLEPLISVSEIRAEKKNVLSGSGQHFNKVLKGIVDIIVRILGRISELDATDLNVLFAHRLAIQNIIGLSVHDNDETGLGEASMEVLKSWTSEVSRESALQHMARLHPEPTLASIVWTMDRVMRTPFPWDPVRPLLITSRDILSGLADPSDGLLRTTSLDGKMSAIVLRWWNEQWRFVSKSCLNIEYWSRFIGNKIMTEFCRDIMELAEGLIQEDGLFMSATMNGRGEKEAMARVLGPAKDNFRGMENMIRLKDVYLVDTTVRVLRKILTRLRENGLEINSGSRKLITDACVPTSVPGKYVRSTNLNDGQRAELLEALGHEDDVQIVQIGAVSQTSSRLPEAGSDKVKRQSKLDAWSKSTPTNTATPSLSSGKSNRLDVLELSRSIENPQLKQIAARQQAKSKAIDTKAISALKESRQREKAEKARRDAETIAKARRLRGEIASGEGPDLPLTGKENARSEIMVNSSDEDSGGESDESDTDNQLIAISTGGQKSLDEHERRKQQALRDKVRRPVKKTRQQRSVKEMRARLIPPMDRLHNTILAWDIFHEGGDPPNGPKATEVATKYPDPTQYQGTFFPLLASEAWRAFVTAKDEITTQAFGMKIASRASVDSYLEVTFTMPVLQNRERGVSEGDILLVSQDENPLKNASAKHCLARVHRLTYKKDTVEITYRIASRNNSLSSILTPGVSVHGIKITNMTTIEREYAALESLQYYDLMDEILKAEPSPILRYGDERVSNAMQNWALNRGQALAVLGAHENDGFTLIQGPPGTGKTKTIIAMVGSLLSEQLSQASAGVPVSNPLRPATAPNANNQARPKKLLVCAPSNAAVDELVLRLKNGVKTRSGKMRNINVLRLGRSDAINAAVKDVTLDELVRVRLEGDNTADKAKTDREKLHQDAAKIKEELGLLRPLLEVARGHEDRAEYSSLSRKFEELKRQQIHIGKMIDADKSSGNTMARERELRRRQVQQEILNSAQVLCATLSGSGHEMFRNLDVEFETVIIDEAAQCVELSALIPLKYGCCKCVLVGDPKQLPPTVLSQSAARFGYDQSLFVRMQQNHPDSVHLLDMQYRMHPEISMFPSREFYEGQLQDGQDMAKLRRQPWHNSELLGAYRFFDVEGVQERGRKGQSLVNVRELEVAMQLYATFSKDYQHCDMSGKIGIITPYKAQLFELRNRFKARFGENITDMVEFNTTDAFQGRECEIIIFSCVRASSTGGIGFMTDIRRMNVGLTRAKSSLWILGDSRALVQGEFWRKLIEDAQNRGRYTKGNIVSMLRQPLKQIKASSLHEEPRVAISREIAMPDAPEQIASADNSTRNGAPAWADSHTGGGAGSGGGNGSAPAARADVFPDKAVLRVGSGPPVIHTSTEARKRPLDNGMVGQPGAKRAANDKQRGGLQAKFGQKASKPAAAPKDPSAMSVLGMTPPERPPAPTTVHPVAPPTGPRPGPKNATSVSAGAGTMTNEKAANKPAPPVARKKSKPSLFLPKKR
ncbi:hypothetical protein DCS_01040 [Drechmeria coniospora]|uniref:Helicase SEN1 n=1 Tax=Drechmeria coniospora TaxID=98403 RepID=A0A151GS15_DRECN|nr:hypothetical protein DCS_01040 [Drechmeria coniospora]KYK59906.1 hypothetical protein DCS_01040 [Drechmeria coniospora]